MKKEMNSEKGKKDVKSETKKKKQRKNVWNKHENKRITSDYYNKSRMRNERKCRKNMSKQSTMCRDALREEWKKWQK